MRQIVPSLPDWKSRDSLFSASLAIRFHLSVKISANTIFTIDSKHKFNSRQVKQIDRKTLHNTRVLSLSHLSYLRQTRLTIIGKMKLWIRLLSTVLDLKRLSSPEMAHFHPLIRLMTRFGYFPSATPKRTLSTLKQLMVCVPGPCAFSQMSS